MAKKKLRKTLPNDLAEQIKAADASGDYSGVHAALEACELNAYGGHRKATALHMAECTPALAEWLVDRGADVNAQDSYGKTPLHGSAFARFHYRLSPDELIRLGADVHHPSSEGLTPLHFAADGKHLPSIQVLLSHGADAKAQSKAGLTPLAYALQRLSNTGIADVVPVVEALLEAGDEVTPAMQDFVRRVAETFGFHRAGFDKDSVDRVSKGLDALCALASVSPPKARVMHDGSSPIVASGANWQEQHQMLWDLLVSSSGPCETIQGEVIRISGRIADEMHRNGGVNWGNQYGELAKALGQHLTRHNGLPADHIAEAAHLVQIVRREPDGTTQRLMELAVQWVALNPTPHPLTK